MRTILIAALLIMLSAKVYPQGWTQTNSTPAGAGVTDMVVMNDGTLIVTTASYNWPSVQGGIRRSTDGGNSWQNVVNAYNGRTLYLGSSGRMFASCWLYPENEGVFFSTNGGANWIQSYFGFANDNVFSIAAKNGDSMVFIGTRDGIFRNFNNGAWIQRNTGLPASSWVRDISIHPGGTILIATTNGVFRSSDHGNNWSPASSGISSGDTIISISKFTNNGTVFCASSSGKAYKTNISSFSWSTVFSMRADLIGKIDVAQLSADIYLVWISSLLEEVLDDMHYSDDEGLTWESTSLGLSGSSPVSSLGFGTPTLTGLKVYAGLFLNNSSGAKIFYNDLKVGVNMISSEIPESFVLHQNYPNPFNPSTKISFDLSSSSHVLISVYDILGNEIEVLANEDLAAGKYSIEWNAGNFSSGTYFYKLRTKDFTQVRKMNLVK